MKEILDTIISLMTLVTLASGLYLAIRRFGLKRELFTFLGLTLDATVVKCLNDLLLIAITVHLENRGDRRIEARTSKDMEDPTSEFLYSDEVDLCKHAGTLKIRSVPNQNRPELFDWYSLEQIKNISVREGNQETSRDLEQINYLAEYQDPKTDYTDVDFWLEPHERYDLAIMIWLPPGTYAMKAYFLGPETEHREEEYWSCTRVFNFESQ